MASKVYLQSPWKGAFAGAQITKEVTVTSNEAASGERVRMTTVDSGGVMLSLFPTFVLVFKEALDFDRLHDAAKELLKRYPHFSGRARTDQEHLEIELNNAGFPLAAVEWPEGSLEDFPAAIGAQDWEGELPARAKMPILLQDSDPMDALFHDAPLFALRLTTLGKGGCVLTCTFYHILGDGTRLVNSLADLGRAYRGGRLPPLGRWLHRDLMAEENIHELLPGGKELVLQARDAVKDDPPLPEGTTFKDILEATYAKPGRDIESWLWQSPPELPKGRRRLSTVMLHLPKLELAQLKQDVIEHASAQGSPVPKYTSTNDVIVGFLWCLRCIYANAPLPGQGGALRPEMGFTVVDMAFNCLKGPAMEGFFGNGSAAAVLAPPPPAPVADGAEANGNGVEANGNGVAHGPDYSREALLKGIAVIAAVTRAAVNDWRDPCGGSIQAFLQQLCSPQRTYKECAQFAGVALSGAVTLRSTLTSWERFPIEEVVFDEAAGPPLHFLPMVPCQADAQSVLFSSMDGSGPVLYMTIPAEKGSEALDVVQSLLPSATYL